MCNSDRSGEKPYCTFIICIRFQSVNPFLKTIPFYLAALSTTCWPGKKLLRQSHPEELPVELHVYLVMGLQQLHGTVLIRLVAEGQPQDTRYIGTAFDNLNIAQIDLLVS